MSRITNHPILGSLNNNQHITFQFNGQQYEAYEHETIAAGSTCKRNKNVKSA